MLPTILLYIVIFLYGIVIGSFLNVLIYRIPKKENIVTTRSHCMNCGYQLRWYDLVPLFSYLALGLIHGAFHYTQWLDFLIGFLCVSVFLLILYYATGGRAIGGGDVKLMAVCGLLLGWKLIIFAFLLGCIIGSVIHLIRMKVSGEGHVLAMGPYLSAGVAIAVLWGNEFLQWYLHFYL